MNIQLFIYTASVSFAKAAVARVFNKIKQCRRIATRYDNLAPAIWPYIQFAFVRRAYESTP
jgi:transposase